MLRQVIKKPRDSHFLLSLMSVKDQFLSLGCFNLQEGTQIRLWEDIVLGNQPLKSHYPSLYNIVQWQKCLVQDL